jgi:hypothetical protein
MSSSRITYLSWVGRFSCRIFSAVRGALQSLLGKAQPLQMVCVHSAIRDWRDASYGKELEAIHDWFKARLGMAPPEWNSDHGGSLNHGETGVKLRALALKDGLGLLRVRLAAALHHAAKLDYSQAAATLRQRLNEVTWMIHQAARLAATSPAPLPRQPMTVCPSSLAA